MPAHVHGCPPRIASASTAAREHRCFLLLDRHVHKNGGSTMRGIFQNLELHNECAYVGYSLSAATLTASQQALRELTADSAPIRLCAEAHMGQYVMKYMHELSKLKKELAARPDVQCSILRTTRVRDPLSFYISFYLWGLVKERNVANSNRTRSSSPGLGKGFIEWMKATPNLQANILLHPSAADDAKRGKLRHCPFAWTEDCARGAYHFLRPDDTNGLMKQLNDTLSDFELVAPLVRAWRPRPACVLRLHAAPIRPRSSALTNLTNQSTTNLHNPCTQSKRIQG
jgi:hypothetical protein